MGTFNDAARTAHIADLVAHYTAATLKDTGGNTVETYDLTGHWSAGAAGVQNCSTVNGTAERDAVFSANPADPKGSLVLSGSGGKTLTLSAGGPGAGAEVTVQNDKAVPDGQVFNGKACNLTGLALTQPA